MGERNTEGGVWSQKQRTAHTCAAASADELYIALQEALKLQKHYAELLNMHDGGQRRSEVFTSPETWIARLREIGNLPNNRRKDVR